MKNMENMKNITINTMLKTLPNGRPMLGQNQLIDLLLRLLPQSSVMDAVQRYYIGFNAFETGKPGDALIFWQMDEEKRIINAKRIHYRADGHRDKNVPPIVMYPGNPQCLFGQHLLADAHPEQPIAIVESEKSALVMSIVKPEFLWMACGSLNNFNEDFLKPLRRRLIMGFPDVDIKRDKLSGVSVSCAMWRKTAKQLRLKGWRIVVDDHLEKTVNSAHRMDKIDVADVALQQAFNEHLERLKRQ